MYSKELANYSTPKPCLINGHLDENKYFLPLDSNFIHSDENTLEINSNPSNFDNCSNCDCDCDCPSQVTNFEMDEDSLENFEEFIQINILITEYHVEQTITISEFESIWNLKLETIDRLSTFRQNLCSSKSNQTDLNYGFFSSSIGAFLEEDLQFCDYLKGHFNNLIDCPFCSECYKRPLIRLEFRYKQRIDKMSSTLPTSTAIRKKRKRAKLMESITAGNVEKIVKSLNNCDPNFIDNNSGETPLSLSINNTSQPTPTIQKIIVALINGGAHIDFRTKDGRTALHCAVQKSNYVALKTLLDLGASPNYRDAHNLTPLFYSILYKSNPKLTQLLLYEHANHGVMDQQGWQEIHHACKLGLLAHLEQLLYYGCDMNCKILGSGNTPLHVAAINDQMDCVRILLMRGCNKEITNNSHQNAYQVAVISGNLALSELIASHKQENVVPYRDKPKYNPARKPPSSAQSSDPAKQQQQALKEEYTKKYLNGTGSGNNCCPSVSPCPSQRSCTTSITVSTTTTSSGVCCELDSSQSEEPVDEGINSEDDNTLTNSSHPSRIEGRREQKIQGRSCSATLQIRGRREQEFNNQTCQTTRNKLDQSSHGIFPVTFYQEKTVNLTKNKKGFGFVLRGDQASSPFFKQPQTQIQPISLQYLDDIEAGGVAEAADLKKGDFLISVNGVDVRSVSHETVVSLIRQSGDKVTMTIATPVYAASKLDQKVKSTTSKNIDSNQTQTTLKEISNNFSNTSQSSLEDRERSKIKSKAPPTPPKRDPSTTLSIGRAKAKSLCISESSSTKTPVENRPLTYDNEEDIKLIDDDSESKSVKSSSTATSIESMVCNNAHKELNKENLNAFNKTKLKDVFSNQLNEKSMKLVKGNHSGVTFQALKKKKKKKLEKDFHSTSDIPQQLESEKQLLATIKANRLSSSQDLETLNSKVTKVENDKVDSSQCFLNDSKTDTLSTVVKVDVSGKHSKHDNFNFAQIKTEKVQTKLETQNLANPISSFKPDSPLTIDSSRGCEYNTAQYKGQENLESTIKPKPFIPDPDYSSEEEALKNMRSETLSTFKSNPAPSFSNFLQSNKMIQSFHGDLSNGEKKFPTDSQSLMTNSVVLINSNQKVNPSIKNKVQSLAEDMQKQLNEEPTLKVKNKEADPCLPAHGNVKSKLETLNKLKASIFPFEIQSKSLAENARFIKPAQKLEHLETSCVQVNSEDKILKVSKSCFEVDCCDNSSSGVSSDVDAEIYFNHHSAKMTQFDQSIDKSDSLNKNKISNLNASDSSKVHLPKISSLTKTNEASTQSSLAFSNAKSIPQTTKTWSEISSAIRAVKGSPGSISTYSKVNLTEGRPTSAPILGKTNPIKIKVQSDGLGKGMINEVDVLAELVPPPPEFAAPPPHLQDHHTKNVQKVQTGKTQSIIASQVKSQTAAQGVQFTSQNLVKKENLRALNPAQQVHIVHKPTPQSQQINMHQQHQGYLHNNLINMESQKLIRKSSTPPPPPPPEFSDCSTASRLGIIDNSHHHLHFNKSTQLNQAQYLQQVAAQQLLHQQLHSGYQMAQPKFSTLNRYHGKQNQLMNQSLYNHGGYVGILKSTNQHDSKTAYSLGNEPTYFSAAASNLVPQDYNYHQFATLTRRKPLQQLSVSMPNYSDYTRLTLQNRLMRQDHSPQLTKQQMEAFQHHLQQQNLNQVETKLVNQTGLVLPPQPTHPPPSGPPPSLQKGPICFLKKSIVDWTEQDVNDWLVSIGMMEHQDKFEFINGVKLLRLDTNDLVRIGVAPNQHIMFILEKIKQHLHYQQQYPPN